MAHFCLFPNLPPSTIYPMLSPVQMETINKLLKKQAPKTNARRKEFSGTSGAGSARIEPGTDAEPDQPDPLFIRYVSNKDGSRLGVPAEWLGGPLGKLYETPRVKKTPAPAMGSKLIQEVE